MRTVGIEEELLLVDATTGAPLTLAPLVIDRAPARLRRPVQVGSTRHSDEPSGQVRSEMQQQQIEINTAPREALGDLGLDLRAWRSAAAQAAGELGARVVATGMSPLRGTPVPTVDLRYAAIVGRFGLTAREQLTCGCHVHVSVASDDEAVGVLDRIRRWLPALLAISANSPYWQGQDTGYASFRSQAWARWPTAGPTEVFGSALKYHAVVDELVETGVLLDRKMVYFDARLSASYPTVEIRVTDVCLRVEDAVLIAALCRALVDTAAEAWAAGEDFPNGSTELLRLATWRAGHDGVDGVLLDPFTARPLPAADVVNRLVAHVRPALIAAGDLETVERQVATVLERGSGARRQRALGSGHGLDVVVAELARATLQ
jgi:carboxylate-amine ligase